MPEITDYGVSQKWAGKWECPHFGDCGAKWTMKPEDGNTPTDKPINIRTQTVGEENVRLYRMACPVCQLQVEGPKAALDTVSRASELTVEAAKNAKPAPEDKDADDEIEETLLPVSAAVPFPTPVDTSAVRALPEPAIDLPPAAHGEGPNEGIKQESTVTAPVEGVDTPPVIHPYGAKEEVPLEVTKSAIVATKSDVESPTHPADDKADGAKPKAKGK